MDIARPERTYVAGDEISFGIKARYLSGGTLGSAEYSYSFSRQPASYTPPGTEWAGWIFGPEAWSNPQVLTSGNGMLGANGETQLKQLAAADGVQGKPYRYVAEARVQDVSRQEIAASSSVLVHPAAFYVGARLKGATKGWWSPFVPVGTRATAEYALVTIDGKPYHPEGKTGPAAGDRQLAITLVRHTWKVAQQRGVYGRINTRYEQVDEIVQEEKLSSADGKGTFSFTPSDAGRYTLRFRTSDRAGNGAVTEISFYATGSSWVRWGLENSTEINIIPDRKTYEVGDTAHLLVQSPVPDGRYLVTLEREGIFEERIVELKGSANVIDIPIIDAHVPVLYVAVASFSKRGAPPASYFEPDLGKPKLYFGLHALKISTRTRNLKAEILPDRTVYSPGSQANVQIRVTDNGKPVEGAEVTFLAVDRGVLDLIDYHVPDPVSFFYDESKFPLGVMGADTRSLLIDPVTYEMKDLPGGDASEGKLGRRKDFTPLAVFEPYLKTDSNGVASAHFKLPDTLTTYRATALIVNLNRFGIQEREIMVQNPLNARTSLPRRLRLRDTARASVILTNLTTEDQRVTVSIDPGILTLNGKSEKQVTVPASGSLAVPFTIEAAAQTVTGSPSGPSALSWTAHLVFTIRSAVLSEQIEDQLVVERSLTEEAFTVTGQTNRGATGDLIARERATVADSFAEEGLVIPESIAPGSGSLSLRVNSSRLANLGEAIRYLADYPFNEYLDNRLNRIIPQILFGDSLSALYADAGTAYNSDFVGKFFSAASRYQLPDGGFSYSPEYRPDVSSPYMSIRMAHVLALAAERGIKVDDTIDAQLLLRYLAGLYNKRVTTYTKIYALYVQALFGRHVELYLNAMQQKGDSIGMSGYGMLGLAFAALNMDREAHAMLDRMMQFVRVGTRSIDLTQTYESRDYFDSGVQSLALLQMLSDTLNSKSDMGERIASTLLQRQRHGRWVNTTDTVWALIAYAQILGRESGTGTDFRLHASVDNQELMNQLFSGISRGSITQVYPLSAPPLSGLKRNALHALRFEKSGTGIAYYDATIRYALPSEVVLPRDEGFSVFTEVTDLAGARVDVGNLSAGTTYRMRVVVSTPKARTMVALRVPVASGAEVLDASFVTTGMYREAGGVNRRSWTRETVYGEQLTSGAEGTLTVTPFGVFGEVFDPIQHIMDNEVRYFFDDFYSGKQEVQFLFRTTTPGIFPTPPAVASCMYEPEVFGRSGGSLFVIRDRP